MLNGNGRNSEASGGCCGNAMFLPNCNGEWDICLNSLGCNQDGIMVGLAVFGEVA